MTEDFTTTDAVSAKPNGATGGFDLSSLAYLDSAELSILHPSTQEPTGWVIEFAGPGHPVSMKVSHDIAKRAIKQRQAREEAQVNGRRWHADPETPEGNIAENAKYYAARMLGWHCKNGPFTLDGREMPFSRELAEELLSNSRYRWLYDQVQQFVLRDTGFIPASETS